MTRRSSLPLLPPGPSPGSAPGSAPGPASGPASGRSRGPSRGPSPRRLTSARGLRACLAQLMDEALGHGFHLAALHIRVAMLELEEVLDAGQAGSTDGQGGCSGSAAGTRA